MKAGKRKCQQRLEAAITDIRLKHGHNALRRLNQAVATERVPHVATGFASLDKALMIGGIPHQRISEIVARPTSGMTTLALKILASAQQSSGDVVAFIDLKQTFDPDYARRCEVDIAQRRFLLVRPQTAIETLEIAESLVASRGVGMLIINAATDLLNAPKHQAAHQGGLHRLNRSLAKSSCAALFLTPMPIAKPAVIQTYQQGGYGLAQTAAVRLFIEKERWLMKRNDIRGYRARVTVVKNKLGRSGHAASISIKFNGTVRGDAA